MTGNDNLAEAVETQNQLKQALSSGGFNLRKWCTNHPALLASIPKEDIEVQIDIKDGSSDQIKTLGLTWMPKQDLFSIKTSWPTAKKVTKRTILADFAHLFDPLGIVNPVIVLAKIFLQQLWLMKLDWDAALPLELHTKWLNFRQGLSDLNSLTVPRHIFSSSTTANIQLHAFADASEKAYGTAIYIRSTDKNSNISVHLLCAKSKVAPTKTTTLPRLELCAAKIMTELVDRLKKILCITIDEIYYWTDSSIVLSWISSESSSYKTFVANRIAAIQESTQVNQWHHIKSNMNPADLISRGVTPKNLLASSIWFNGPEFLQRPESKWPDTSISQMNVETEKKQRKVVLMAVARPTLIQTIHHNNSFKRLQETMAFILRFSRNIRLQKHERRLSKVPTANELQDALIFILKEMQQQEFGVELKQLQKEKYVQPTNKLATLTPFLDDQGLIRVGGRLQASNLSFEAKHPVLLPYSHLFTRLLMKRPHLQHLHAGPQALLAITRQRYWPLRGKILAHSIVHQCIICSRARPKVISQLMGGLPAERIQPARPFVNVVIDFCGPIHIHYKIRGKKPTKAYIAVFVCFTTKATHLEVVSDLTTSAFIGALKRFIGRRGRPAKIFCDNATNFVGA